MRNALKRICEHKEKEVYCFHCHIYTEAVHYCTMEKQWIHQDRYNRQIIYSSTEVGATPKNPNDVSDILFTMDIPKFAVDNRTSIRDVRKETQHSAKVLSYHMEIIFGEHANLEINKEVNQQLNFKTHEEFKNSKAWFTVNSNLSYNPILSYDQWNVFNELRKNGKVLDRYNVLAKEKQKEAEKKRQEERQQEEICKRQEQRQREEQRKQIMQIRQRQNDAFEESVRMINLYHS